MFGFFIMIFWHGHDPANNPDLREYKKQSNIFNFFKKIQFNFFS